MRASVIAAAVVAAVVGFGGTLAMVVEAARHVGATPDQAASWAVALCLGIAVTSLGLSVRYRMPVVTAWSLAGAVLIAGAPAGTDVHAVVGASLLSAALMVLAGAVPALGAAIGRIPATIAGAMLAGLLLRFLLALFQAAQTEPGLVLTLIAVFLVARMIHAASAPLVVIAAGVPLAMALGHAIPAPSFALSPLTLIPPSFSPAALVGLGIPLFLVTMATQQISGAAVLRTSGYAPPVQGALVATGLTSLATAPFGGHSVNLSSLSAAICTGPDAHPDPAKRWLTGPPYAFCYLLFAPFCASFATLFASLPTSLIAVVVGTAMLGPMTGALASAMHVEQDRFAAVVAFGVTASGITLLDVGAAFWGLLAGLLVLGLTHAFQRRPASAPAPGPVPPR